MEAINPHPLLVKQHRTWYRVSWVTKSGRHENYRYSFRKAAEGRGEAEAQLGSTNIEITEEQS